MPTAYEKTYGAVKFYDLGGTAIFDTESDLGLWTTMDEEPSPEPKWIRVDVPGADGAVDLSRALAGQTTYEMREIRLGFGGKCADHATALALVHQMRRALHGARVRVETLLTAQIGGYYVADCECDGIAYASGDVEVSVMAAADPFIRVGNQTLTLPVVAPANASGAIVSVPSSRTAQQAEVSCTLPTYVMPSGYVGPCPRDATWGRLWWANGENLLDVSAWPVLSRSKGALSPYWTPRGAMWLDGQTIKSTVLMSGIEQRIEIRASDARDQPYISPSFPFGTCGVYSGVGGPSALRLTAFVNGTVTSVGSSPAVTLEAIYNTTGLDADGWSQAYDSTWTGSASFTPAAGTVSQVLSFSIRSSSCRVLSAVALDVKDVVGNLDVKVMLSQDASTPATWEAASVGSVSAYFDAPVGGGWYSGTNYSDIVTLTPTGALVQHYVTIDPFDGQYIIDVSQTSADVVCASTGMPPSSSKHLAMTLEMDGGPDGYTLLDAYFPTASTATGTNSTMRSTPSVTTNHGATITIDGRTATVGPGTVDLPALVIPGGTFTVDYSLFGSSPTDATLLWEGGVL